MKSTGFYKYFSNVSFDKIYFCISNSWRWKLFVEMARIINAFSVYMRWLLNPPSYIQQGYIDH
jgi:hypothetical protein